VTRDTVICFAGPLGGQRITNCPEHARIYSNGSTDVAEVLSRHYWHGAVGYYEKARAPNLQWIAEWHELET
jgi:hypothetical protein